MSPLAHRAQHPRIVLVLVALCALIEIGLTLAGTLAPALDLRRQALIYGAVWPAVWTQTDGFYLGHKVVMLVSYAFLHGGLLHMVFNMLMLLHLGRQVVWRIGAGGFALVFVLTAIAGALFFIGLHGGRVPMVGASGVVFGLFGVTLYWDIQRRRVLNAPMRPVLSTIGALILMNVILWVMTQGALAWEAHLGGFVAGAAIAWAITPTLGHRIGQPRR